MRILIVIHTNAGSGSEIKFDLFCVYRYTAYKCVYYHIHGRAKVSQAKRDRTILPNCVGKCICICF